ncbi:MAG: NUDIX domain-containing protein [Pseudomonadota bacterium]
MDEEFFETFDETGTPTGTAPRSLVHRNGLWHRAANVLLFDDHGHLLLQQRSAHKDVCPGLWDLSVAEHLQPGEAYLEGALRGAQEELGLTQLTLTPLGDERRFQLELPAQDLRDFEFQQSFRGQFTTQPRIDPLEVAQVRTLSLAQLQGELNAQPHTFTPWFRSLIEALAILSSPAP